MRELYLEKLAILREVLKLTDDVTFRGDSGDADIYITLISKRDELLDKAKEIDGKLAQDGHTGKEPEAEQYTQEIASLSRQIVERDNYMKSRVSKMLDEAKTDVRNINTGKNLSNAYGKALSGSGGLSNGWSQ